MNEAKAEKVEIRPLSPELAEDFLGFFDGAAFADNPYWEKCYCHYYHSMEEPWDAKDAAHRSQKEQEIKAGRATGVLAYVNGSVAGWCNAGPREGYENLRAYSAALDDTTRVGSIMCFVVAPEHRGKGMGSALLSAACDFLKESGLRFAEGYPSVKRPGERMPWTAHNYHGSSSMYERAGFEEVRRNDYFKIMRKTL